MKKLSLKMKKVVLFTGIVLPLFLAQLSVQKALNGYPVDKRESFLYLPSGEHLKPLTIGYPQVVADLLWIETVHYFGSHLMSDREYPWLFHILTLIIDLDPRFDFPYYFGGIVLSLEASQMENANHILERGMEAYPNKWEYPFYIGFNYYHHQGDAKKAIPFIEKAAQLSGSPPFVKSLVGTLYSDTGDIETAMNFYRSTYENTTDEMVKKKIEERLNKIAAQAEEDVSRD